MSAKDGGPAFAGYRAGETFQAGMSLRDYFAGQALLGLAAGHLEGVDNGETFLARIAYAYADAMIAERAKGQS